MQKAGLISEMTSDALDSALGGEDLEEEADEAVDAVLREVAGDIMDALPAAKARPVGGGCGGRGACLSLFIPGGCLEGLCAAGACVSLRGTNT